MSRTLFNVAVDFVYEHALPDEGWTEADLEPVRAAHARLNGVRPTYLEALCMCLDLAVDEARHALFTAQEVEDEAWVRSAREQIARVEAIRLARVPSPTRAW